MASPITRAKRRLIITTLRRAARPQRRTLSSRRGTAVLAAGIACGAAGEYLLDPQGGKRRRHVARDRTTALLRRGGRSADRQARYAAGVAKGTAHGITHPGSGPRPGDIDDITLARKVESEIFRPVDAPKGQVSVSAVDGVVELRGAVDPEHVEGLAAAARAVAGVRDVRNLLHPVGTPAPGSGG